MTAAAPETTDLRSTMEEMRASVAAEETDNRLAALLQDAFLKILEMLMALLLDFRAGKLAPVADATGAASAADASYAASGAPGEAAAAQRESGSRGWWPASWFRRHARVPAVAPRLRLREWDPVAGMTSESAQCATSSDGAACMPRQDNEGPQIHSVGKPARVARSGREADQQLGCVHEERLNEVHIAEEAHERRASPPTNAPRFPAACSDAVVCARWWVTPRVREAYPPCRRDGGAVRRSFLKKRILAREDRRDLIVPA